MEGAEPRRSVFPRTGPNTPAPAGSTFKVLTAFAPALDTCGATPSTVYYDAPYTVGQKTFRNWYAKKGYMG